MSRIPLLIPRMPSVDSLLPYLRQIDGNKQYTNYGPLNGLLERRIVADVSPHLTDKNVTTVSNCTVGLELALQAVGLGPGARVLLPAITFVATATAIIRVGMIPVFSDVGPTTWCLTPDIAESASSLTSLDAVMPVSTFGRPQDTAAWDDFARRHGMPVVIDAAGAYGNQTVGELADVVFSFHATKSFGTAEGGAVLSSDERRIRRVRQLANFGIDTSIGQLTELGTNGKMSEYHCAIGLASFDHWDDTKRLRIELADRYLRKLGLGCPDVSFQEKPADGIYPLMPVLLPTGVRAADVAAILFESGIETRRWYCPPLHTHAALKEFPSTGHLPVAEDIGERILGLPFFIEMTDAQIDRTVESLRRAIDRAAGASS